MRQIILDTETTGLEPGQGHRIIEIGAVEMINRRLTGNNFHHYINPEREIDEAAYEVHGISTDDLKDKSFFEDLAPELLTYLKDAELIIHNAPFDVGFLNHEFEIAGYGDKVIDDNCRILDTLALARNMHPGQKNSLDALCKRYEVDNSQRTLHGALLDSEILADVYLQMTGGQIDLLGDSRDLTESGADKVVVQVDAVAVKKLVATWASKEELEQHDKWLSLLRKESEEGAVWDNLESTGKS